MAQDRWDRPENTLQKKSYFVEQRKDDKGLYDYYECFEEYWSYQGSSSEDTTKGTLYWYEKRYKNGEIEKVE